MNLPDELSIAIENCITPDVSFDKINGKAKDISLRYRENDNSGKRLLTDDTEAIAYAISRMPATYGAVYSALSSICEYNEFDIEKVFDIGAGTGTGTWAAREVFGDKKFFCFEREDAMIKIGKDLMKDSFGDLVSWRKFDVINEELEDCSDLSIISYMINELPKEKVEEVIDKIWNATNKVLVIVEPGTPRGFDNIKMVRDYLLSKGEYIVSPCSHSNKCDISRDDWCAFSCRVQRTKMHKLLKDGDAPYEDEKFSYIVFSKVHAKQALARILRHPIINKGYSEFKVCTKDGIKDIKLSKKNGDIYKISKKKSAGDSLDI